MLSQRIVASATPCNIRIMPFYGSNTSTKSRSVVTFNSNMILVSAINWSSSKRSNVESFSLFGSLFLSKKLAKANSFDNKLLLQILEKIKILNKAFVK